jgi:hypothetical protein
LLTLLDLLADAPGETGGSLLDETLVLSLSEMGRAPVINGSGGKDHWPYTSALLVGGGLSGGRVLGGTDESQVGTTSTWPRVRHRMAASASAARPCSRAYWAFSGLNCRRGCPAWSHSPRYEPRLRRLTTATPTRNGAPVTDRRRAVRDRRRESVLPDLVVHEAAPPVPATAMVIDLRNFTPSLMAAPDDARGVNEFCHFLSDFYARCLRACLVALPEALRSAPPLHMSSTGDGVVVVFTDVEGHHRHAFLAALVLHHVLDVRCDLYNGARPEAQLATSYGIGLESGSVHRVRALPRVRGTAPVIDTFIGACINVAARAEGVTKTLARSRCILAGDVNCILVRDLFGVDYDEMVAASVRATDDAERLEAQDQMARLNRDMCLTFMHDHVLKGVEQPVALYRVAESAMKIGNPRFEHLMRRLATGDEDHLAQLRAVLNDAEHSLGEPPLPDAGPTDASPLGRVPMGA